MGLGQEQVKLAPQECPQKPWGSRPLLQRASELSLTLPQGPQTPEVSISKPRGSWSGSKSSGLCVVLSASERNPEAETLLLGLADLGCWVWGGAPQVGVETEPGQEWQGTCLQVGTV